VLQSYTVLAFCQHLHNGRAHDRLVDARFFIPGGAKMQTQPELLTATIHVPLPPSARAEIDRLAKIEDRKPATVARRLILAALQQHPQVEVHHAP
jgi:hypothetical protein